MPPRLHVLLIGIDAYDGGGMLTGCVNDIDLVQRLLIDRVGVPIADIRRLAAPRTGTRHEVDVPEEPPVLATIVAALERLGTEEVGPDDRVLIYYSGHGTQCIVSSADGRRFAREALLPKDKKRGAENRLLFDWELNTLIARIADRTSAVTVILDCCNSAGATRSLDEFESMGMDRFWTAPEVTLSRTTVVPDETLRGVAAGLGSLQRCQVIAACRDDQRARESPDEEGRSQGVLTRALIARLSETPDADLQDVLWGRIWRGVEADVRDVNPRQSPWLFGSFGRRVFGVGPDLDSDPGYAVVEVPGGYLIDAGTLAGVTEGAEIGVYGMDPPAFPSLGTEADLAARRGTIRVVHAESARSRAVAVAPFALPAVSRGRLVAAGRDAGLRVALAPEDPELTAQLGDSPLVELVGAEQAELILLHRPDGSRVLVDDVHGGGDLEDEPVLAVIPPDRPQLTRAAVEHYYAYSTPLRMARACRDLPGALRVSILDCGVDALTAEEAQNPGFPEVPPGVHAPYQVTVGDRICFIVENTADAPIAVALLDCAPSGRVALIGEKVVPRRSRHVFWAGETLGTPFRATLRADRTVGVDRIVAIGTTRPDVSLRHLEVREGFGDVLGPLVRGGADFRDLSEDVGNPPIESWTSAVTALRIVRTT